jgi:nucleotidyltransferase/DNA polymerase involved in DNA repair
MARIACIMVADFSIAALVRSNPALADKVLAIAQSLAPHAELDAVSVRARESGIRPGMRIAQARAISSDLIVVHRSPRKVRRIPPCSTRSNRFRRSSSRARRDARGSISRA